MFYGEVSGMLTRGCVAVGCACGESSVGQEEEASLEGAGTPYKGGSNQ